MNLHLRVGSVLVLVAPVALAQTPAAPPANAPPPSEQQPAADEARIAELERRLAEQDTRLAELERERAATVRPAATPTPIPANPPATTSTDASKQPIIERTQRPDPLAPMVAKDFPKSVPLFGSDFRFALGGYVKLEAIYDFNGHPDRFAFTVAGIPQPGDPGSSAGYVSFNAKESRFRFDVRYMAKGAPSNQALIELDFFTSSSAPRLRHAYFRWGAFLAGQTWSLLTDMRPLPFIIDFAFTDSINATRVPQLRYQASVKKWLVVRAGLEMPELSGVDNPEALPGAVNPRFPRAAFAASLEGKRAFLSGGASLGELRWDGQTVGQSYSALAWMAVLNSRILLDEKGRGFIGLHGAIGEGTGELTGALAGQNSNATLTDEGLQPMLSGHGMVGAGCRWLPVLSTNAAVAWDVLVPSEQRLPDELQAAWSVHANVIGHLSEPLQIGLEGMVGEAKNVDGRSGIAGRTQAMAMYSF
jgi:hypothetical protein